MTQVAVVGSLSMDLTAQTASLPSPGETVIGRGFTMVPGGKGNNQAVTCARQGVTTAMVGRVGSDGFGDVIRAQLIAEGVDVSHLTADPQIATGIAHITVDSTGQNFIIIVPRSNHSMTTVHLEQAATLIGDAAVMLVQLEIRLEVVKAALGIARRAGTTTVLNPAPALELDDELLSMVDFCIPNEVEAATLTQMKIDDLSGAVKAAKELRRRGCRAVIVTLGAKGAIFVDRERTLEVPSLSVPVVDTVAAGDAFCGTFASSLARGEDLEVGLVKATGAGALAVGVPGATPSLPLAGAVDEIIARLGPVELKSIAVPPG
ncbi:MAG: ribokinase [Acidimicrobiales bacterium]|jgi:ribokinase